MRIAIIGMGLMGGSLGLAMRSLTTGVHVVGYDRDPEALALGVELGVCDEAANSIKRAVGAADIVVLAVPVDQFAPVAAEVHMCDLDEKVPVTDICSVKRLPVALGERLFGERFVGGHPMAGSENTGVSAAEADLLPGACWFLTRTEKTAEAALQTISSLVCSIGCRPFVTTPDSHDEIVASLSHLPFVLSVALSRSVVRIHGQDACQLAGRSFPEMTRIAGSDPAVWTPVLAANGDQIVASLKELMRDMSELGRLIDTREWDQLGSCLEETRDIRTHRRSVARASADTTLRVGAGSWIAPQAPPLLAPFPERDTMSQAALGSDGLEKHSFASRAAEESSIAYVGSDFAFGGLGSPKSGRPTYLERAASSVIRLRNSGSPLGPM